MARYLFASQNKRQKEKQKQKSENNSEKITWRSVRRRPTPAQPAQRGTGVFFPSARLQAARWNATELAGQATSPPEASRPPRGLISRLHAPGDAVTPFPPPVL